MEYWLYQERGINSNWAINIIFYPSLFSQLFWYKGLKQLPYNYLYRFKGDNRLIENLFIVTVAGEHFNIDNLYLRISLVDFKVVPSLEDRLFQEDITNESLEDLIDTTNINIGLKTSDICISLGNYSTAKNILLSLNNQYHFQHQIAVASLQNLLQYLEPKQLALNGVELIS